MPRYSPCLFLILVSVCMVSIADGGLITVFEDDFSGVIPFTTVDNDLTFSEADTGWHSRNNHGGIAPIQNEMLFITGTGPLGIVVSNPGTWSGSEIQLQFDWINGLSPRNLNFGLIGFDVHSTPAPTSEFFNFITNGNASWRGSEGGILNNELGIDNATAVNILDDTQTFGDIGPFQSVPGSKFMGAVNSTEQFSQTFSLQNFSLADFDYIGLYFSADNGQFTPGHERYIDNVSLSFSASTVPEPTSIACFSMVVICSVCLRRRREQKTT